jgi:heme A synthase
LKPARTLANIVGPMLFVQVILGGSVVLLGLDFIYHFVWGMISFAALIATTLLGARDFGRSSNMVKVGVAAILDFVLQGALGFVAFSSNVVVVVHLTNAFVLGTLVTYFIIFADSADKGLARMGPLGQSPSS